MALLNHLQNGKDYEPIAFDKMKHLLLSTFPMIARRLSDSDKETLQRLRSIPDYLGGLGSEG
jgi:hypothetical protein